MDADRELMRLHIATLFTQDDLGRLVRANESSGAPAPRFFLGRIPRAREWRVRHDVDSQTADELAALCSADASAVDDLSAPTFPTPFEPVLARSSPVQKTWAGPVFHPGTGVRVLPGAVAVSAANVEILRAHLGPWVDSVPNEMPIFAATVDGEGYASIATAAWLDAIRRSGLVPLYSTSWPNTASRALARRLGLTQFGADLHFT